MAKLDDFKVKDEGSDNTDLDKKAKELKTVKMVEKLLTRAKKYREPWDKDWVENYQFYKGRHWKEKRPSYRHSEVINLTRSTIQNVIVPILTDNRPNIEAIPEEPSDYEFSDILTHILRSKWDRDLYSKILIDAIIDASLYGVAIGEVPWDEELLHGVGDFEFRTCDPFYFYVNPDAIDVNDSKTKYVINAVPTDVEDVKQRYPEKAHLITSDLSDIEISKTSRTGIDDFRVRSAVDAKTLVEGDRAVDPESPDKVLLITLWSKDNELVEKEDEVIKEDGAKKKVYKRKKKYPNGRKIVIANSVLLEDTENPYMDGKFPYARLVDNQMPREFWGDGEVSQTKSVNMMIDKIMSYILDVMIITGNPIWKVPLESGVSVDDLINAPGLVVEYNGGAEPRREPGTQLQPYILATLDRLIQIFDKENGINEVSRGASPGANASGIAIERLQEAAQTKLRMKSRNIEYFLTEIGQLMISRIMQYYKTPRIIRVTNEDAAIKYFKFFIDEDADETGEVQRRLATFIPFEEIEGQIVQGAPQEFEVKGNLDVKVSTGSALPFAKAAKAARARELFQLGILDAEDLLEAIEWPKKEKIVQKVKEREDAAMQAQQMNPEQQQ